LLASEQVSPLSADFPVIAGAEMGQKSRYLFMNCHSYPNAPAEAMFDSIARVDLETGAVELGQPGNHQYPMEPILAVDADQPDQTWVLSVVYDAQEHASRVHIYAADRLPAGPVCILALPEPVPFGFHGTWRQS
jgi:carotenoid cleavage dioxygenase-like enzyme